jgi:hypothetical protein
LRTGDESDQRGDTVHVGTMVKRRIGFLPNAHRQGGIEIHTDRARLEVLHPSASTLHFRRQPPSEHVDRAFGEHKIRGSRHRTFANATAANEASTVVHMLERQPASRRTRREASMSIMRRVPGHLSPRFLGSLLQVVNEHVNIPKARLVDGDLDMVGPRVGQWSNHLVTESWIAPTTATAAGPHLSV